MSASVSGKGSTVKNHDFLCRCSEKEAQRCDAVLARAKEIIGKKRAVEDDSDFMDRAIVWLAVDGDFSFAWDQWGAISVRPFEKHPTPEIDKSFYSQCDRPIDGLAAAIVFYYDAA